MEKDVRKKGLSNGQPWLSGDIECSREKFTKITNDAMPQEKGIYLRTEGVPDTVLVLGDGTILSCGTLNGDALLAVDSSSRRKVFGDKHVLLAAASDENTGVTVRLLFAKKKKVSVSD
jgi:hypothetical protein